MRELEGDNRAVFIARCLESIRKFKEKYVSANAGGQVARAANKFALVSLAGELATRWQITGWVQGQARFAAVTCFNSWLKARGGEGNLEDKQMLDHVRHQITKYGESRFKRWDEPEDSDNAVIDSHVPITAECWGYRREITEKDVLDGNTSDVVFHVFPDAFTKDLCKGFDAGRVARLLRDLGALELTESDKKEKRLVTKVRLPRMGKKAVPVYKIRNSLLFGGDDDTEEEVKQVSGF